MNGVSIIRPECQDETQKSVLFKTNAEIGELPSYLHITEVSINSFQRCIVEFLPLLRQFSKNFYECKFWLYVYFDDDMDHNKYFHAPSKFLTCFEEQMLPLLEAHCSSIRFGLNICSNPNDIMSLIASLLKFSPIQVSRYVSFEICGEFDASTQHLLDTDSITNVLLKPMKYFVRKEKKRNRIAVRNQLVCIEICEDELRISKDSITELIETLKTVSTFLKD